MYLPSRKAGEEDLCNDTIDVCFGVVHMDLGTRVGSKAPIMSDMHACVKASSCELIYTKHVLLTHDSSRKCQFQINTASAPKIRILMPNVVGSGSEPH